MRRAREKHSRPLGFPRDRSTSHKTQDLESVRVLACGVGGIGPRLSSARGTEAMQSPRSGVMRAESRD